MIQIINSDCLEAMKNMADNSIDFIVTDPPYGLSFMNKKWDEKTPSQDIWEQALRICKPGAYIAAFGGSRTHHHLMIAIEKAGWEIRDVIMWLYGSGFPKGKGCLKPAYEPIILGRKKAPKPVLNIDECRIAGKEYIRKNNVSPGYSGGFKGNITINSHEKGRWPANVIFDEEAAEMLDQQSGISKSSASQRNNKAREGNSLGKEYDRIGYGHNDSGGASRFFYCAKASSRERNAGLEGMPLIRSGTERMNNSDGRKEELGESERLTFTKNPHPTVKPIALMKYIIKLLAPPNNPILLDPFCGSGSTLVAAKELGINTIGIELSQEYCEIAQKRCDHVQYIPEQLDLFEK